MKTAICTISTQSHLYKCRVLFDSIKKVCDTDLHCLVTDGTIVNNEQDIVFSRLTDIDSHLAKKLQHKYKEDELRWSFKPVYVKHLLEQGYEKVIYVDNDIYFFSSPAFIFELLEENNFILTPHFYPFNPRENQNWLEANYRVGLYNAGFFAANKQAINILDWWTECCLYAMKKAYWRGLYDDQKYLDLIPVRFENVKVLKHEGCNLAGWNDENRLFSSLNQQPTVNGKDIVFVHFAELSMERFSSSIHPLNGLYNAYIQHLKKYNPVFQWKKKRWSKLYWHNVWYYVRWKFTH